MSCDLYFWKQTTKCRKKPSEVIESLIEGNDVEGVDEIPTDEILENMKREFPEIWENKKTNPEMPIQLIWDSPSDDSCFLISWSKQYLGIEGHGVDGEIFNRIIDLMIKYGCPLYDPQVDSRYKG